MQHQPTNVVRSTFAEIAEERHILPLIGTIGTSRQLWFAAVYCNVTPTNMPLGVS